jgi:hypothetical protein
MFGPEGTVIEATIEAPTTDALIEAADGLHAISNGVWLRFLSALVDLDEREAWREDGVHSILDWIVYRYGFARRTASELLRVAHKLRELPAITAAFADGRLCRDKPFW